MTSRARVESALPAYVTGGGAGGAMGSAGGGGAGVGEGVVGSIGLASGSTRTGSMGLGAGSSNGVAIVAVGGATGVTGAGLGGSGLGSGFGGTVAIGDIASSVGALRSLPGASVTRAARGGRRSVTERAAKPTTCTTNDAAMANGTIAREETPAA